MPRKKLAEPKPESLPTWTLTLTQVELLHLRDLISVLLPPDGTKTVSQSLAEGEGRQIAELKLWKKLVELCHDAGLPLDEAAPDYVIMPVGAPVLGIAKIAPEAEGGELVSGTDEASSLFEAAPEPPEPPQETPKRRSKGNKGKKK